MRLSEKLWSSAIAITILVALILCTKLLDKATSTYSAITQGQNNISIVIDAGHGGIDGGAVSHTGVHESQVNLQIALRLNDLFQLLGYRTKMIRTEDISVYTKGTSIAEKKISDLKERVRIINNTENAVLISIHQNFFQDSRYHGAQVFYGKNGNDLGRLLQSKFTTTLNVGSKRKAKRAEGIYLMEKINCVGVLVECGFLSNPSEEMNLLDQEYQKRLCCVIASVTSNYINDCAVA